MQALWFSIADTIAPFIVTSPARVSSSQRARVRPTQPRYRCFTPLRTEAREVAALLTADPARPWTLDCLAAHVHLSASRLCEVFTEAYGKTPQAYLTMLRAELLAHLLRDTDLPIETAVRQVGWCSRGHAAHRFRQCVGVTPSQYRQLSHTAT
jgi:AraC-like DNA-binding protein